MINPRRIILPRLSTCPHCRCKSMASERRPVNRGKRGILALGEWHISIINRANQGQGGGGPRTTSLAIRLVLLYLWMNLSVILLNMCYFDARRDHIFNMKFVGGVFPSPPPPMPLLGAGVWGGNLKPPVTNVEPPPF